MAQIGFVSLTANDTPHLLMRSDEKCAQAPRYG